MATLVDTLLKKIIADRKKTHISRSCKVCVPMEREEDKRNGVECKHPGMKVVMNVETVV